jgi:hypothetical protein
MPLFLKQTRKQYILSQLYTTVLLRFSYKPFTLAGFEPGSSVPGGHAVSIVPHRPAPRPGSSQYQLTAALQSQTWDRCNDLKNDVFV